MIQRKLSKMQILLGVHLQELGIAEDEILFEHKLFVADFGKESIRNWRFDVYLPELRLGIEIHGGQFSGGHRRGYWGKNEYARRKALGTQKHTPQEDEYDKLNHAQMNGIRVFQFSNEQVSTGRAKDFLAGVL